MSKRSDQKLSDRVFEKRTDGAGRVKTGVVSLLVYGNTKGPNDGDDDKVREFGDNRGRETVPFGGTSSHRSGAFGFKDLLFTNTGR